MDYSRGIQTFKLATKEVISDWKGLYNTIIDNRIFILLVYCVSNILYIIVSLLYKLFSYRRN